MSQSSSVPTLPEGSPSPIFGPDVELAPSVFVAPGVQAYGRIRIERGVSLWPHATIRAETMDVEIRGLTNLQDFAMVHIGYGVRTEIGAFCSVTHHATVHGSTIEDGVLVGINAVVMDGARVGRGSIVAPGAVVTEGTQIPPHSIVAGVPGKVIKERDSERENRLNAWQYYRNARAFQSGDHRSWDGDEYAAWLRDIRGRIETDEDLAAFAEGREAELTGIA